MGSGLVKFHNLLRFPSTPLIHLDKWGPAAWHFLHTITFVYPNNPTTEERTTMTNFFSKTLPLILPCKVCATHYSSILSNFPIQAENRETLSKWLVEIHNQVNSSTQKPSMTYEQVRKLYVPLEDDDKQQSSQDVIVFFCSVTLILFIVGLVFGSYYILRS